MLGVVYFLWIMTSHVVAVVKEASFNLGAKIDPRTNTFTNYSGNLVDFDTGELRFWSKESNGDEVLRDKRFRIVRNLSEEDRNKAYEKAKKESSGFIAINTNERRWVSFNNGITNVKCKATIFKDLRTGAEYASANVMVDRSKKEKKEFYVDIADPNTLICISDRQRKLEQHLREQNLYNWLAYPDDEKVFIDNHNKKELSMSSGRELIFSLN